MKTIFDLVYQGLQWLASVTGFSYHEINILVFYVLLPLVLLYFVGRIFNSVIPVAVYAVLCVIGFATIGDFSAFSTSLFNWSVNFLKGFDVIGLNYTQASVIVCIIAPILVIIVLHFLAKVFED